MSSLIIAGDVSGTVTLQAPAAAGSTVINLPTVTGGSFIVSDASGNVGIGTSSPAAVLDVRKASGAVFGIIGTSSGGGPGAGLVIAGTQTGVKNWVIANQYNVNGLEFTQTTAAGGTTIGSTPSMMLDTSGNLLVGTTSNQNGVIGVVGKSSTVVAISAGVTNNGDNAVTWRNAAGSAVAGVTVNSGTIVYGTVSDYRLKENTEPMTNALEKVALLKPCTYTWKETGEAGQGFLAHELQEVIPDAVAGVKDAVYEDGSARYQSVDTSFIVATLTAAIQELNVKVEAQAAEIAALKGQAQ